MTPGVRATLIRIQQRVVEHYNRLLRQNMSDQERSAIREKLAPGGERVIRTFDRSYRCLISNQNPCGAWIGEVR